jgi:hypothetical protein
MRVGGQRNAPASLPPGKRPGVHFMVGWVGPECGKSRTQPEVDPGWGRAYII